MAGLQGTFTSWSAGRFSAGARPTPLTVIAVLVAIAIALPVLVVLQNIFVPSQATWRHLVQTVLGDYVLNSLLLMAGVAFGVMFGGVLTAWITTMCRFPGRRIFEWALLLPMAMPAYVMAYAYTDLLQFSGPVQTALRGWMGWHAGQYWYPDVRSLGGAVLMFSLVLYPYVYLLARAAFLEQ
ncbi:MAG TPA: iron ABC transporter permease, partial [Burkholderiales bacterium]|nr:iron ABC transporter permease [Burkholderiales bacterium]